MERGVIRGALRRTWIPLRFIQATQKRDLHFEKSASVFFLLRVSPILATGSPASFQAVMPPARIRTDIKPFFRKTSAALTERLSLFQTVTIECVR